MRNIVRPLVASLSAARDRPGPASHVVCLTRTQARFVSTLLVSLPLLLAGCLVPAPSPTPAPTATAIPPITPILISHPKPVWQMDLSIYEQIGCEPFSNDCPPEDSELALMGCVMLWPEDPDLGGLDPAYPIAPCGLLKSKKGVYTVGCMFEAPIGFIVLVDSQQRLITTRQELQDLYAPIESEDEALSYAVAMTGHYPMHFDEVRDDGEYFVERLEDTHVTKTADGYRVNLYQSGLCGCGYPELRVREFTVLPDGQVNEPPDVLVYRDKYQICVD